MVPHRHPHGTPSSPLWALPGTDRPSYRRPRLLRGSRRERQGHHAPAVLRSAGVVQPAWLALRIGAGHLIALLNASVSLSGAGRELVLDKRQYGDWSALATCCDWCQRFTYRGERLTFGEQMLNWYRLSLRVRRTAVTGAVAALVCVGVSALFLLFAGTKAADSALDRSIGTWNRMVPLITQGPLPPVLRSGRVEAIQVLDAQGRVVAATPQLVGKPPMATFRSISSNVRTTRVLCPPAGLKGCLRVFSWKVYQPDGVWLLYAAVPVVPWYG